jgi:hypothetical protein
MTGVLVDLVHRIFYHEGALQQLRYITRQIGSLYPGRFSRKGFTTTAISAWNAPYNVLSRYADLIFERNDEGFPPEDRTSTPTPASDPENLPNSSSSTGAGAASTGGQEEKLESSTMYNFKRHVFVTNKGYLGSAPAAVKTGDTLCYFTDYTIPFLLRRREDGDGWVLVCAAYVDGMMDGQGWQLGMPHEDIVLH